MAEIVTTDEFAAWFRALNDEDGDAVIHVVRLLEVKGLALGMPYSSALRGTDYGFRELRSKSHGKALRIVYAYDKQRDAVLIVGGDKSGKEQALHSR